MLGFDTLSTFLKFLLLFSRNTQNKENVHCVLLFCDNFRMVSDQIKCKSAKMTGLRIIAFFGLTGLKTSNCHKFQSKIGFK